jgi:hypothetical protein
MVTGPRHRKAVCVSTAGEAEEHNAIAAKTGHRVFARDETANEKRRQTGLPRLFEVWRRPDENGSSNSSESGSRL